MKSPDTEIPLLASRVKIPQPTGLDTMTNLLSQVPHFSPIDQSRLPGPSTVAPANLHSTSLPPPRRWSKPQRPRSEVPSVELAPVLSIPPLVPVKVYAPEPVTPVKQEVPVPEVLPITPKAKGTLADPFDSTASLRNDMQMTQKPRTPPVTLRAASSGGLFARPEPPALQATFVSDNNIPDGHPFPAGAEFVKSWRLLNGGPVPWPVDTRLVFVGGLRMGSHEQAPNHYDVGAVAVGQAVDVWAGDMKAPETSGHWTSYWRLSDGQGVQFGDRVWCDIVVMEPELSESSSNLSLSSSSIIMPSSAPEHTPVAGFHDRVVTSPTFSVAMRSNTTASIGTQSIGTGSLLDDSDSDSEIWEETRREVPPPVAAAPEHDAGFVVLYDSSSAEDA